MKYKFILFLPGYIKAQERAMLPPSAAISARPLSTSCRRLASLPPSQWLFLTTKLGSRIDNLEPVGLYMGVSEN